jgi:hypothetical protein
MFNLMLFSYAPPSYAVRRKDEPAPMYPAHLLGEIQHTLAKLADIAVQREIEREHSNRNDTQLPMSDAA